MRDLLKNTWRAAIILNLEFHFNTVLKFYAWAERLPDNIDFIDYWYNLYLSKTKARIESSLADNINAFHWTRWQEDFEVFTDGYKPLPGHGYTANMRQWFGQYMQFLVYGLDTPSRLLAEHYGKDVFLDTMEDWFKYHTFGADQFVQNFAEKYGTPGSVTGIVELHM